MSADDFQNKYASVMESMLRSAVAETTKIFETMVDELREEISSIRKENEELKIRCSRFEKTENKSTVHIGENNSPSGRSVSSKKCDSSVQCDLVNLHAVPAEPCQPWHDHQYTRPTEQNAQMRISLLQQEEESSRICSVSELEQAEVELSVVSKPANKGEASVRAENEESCGIDGCSTDEQKLRLTDGKSRGSDLAETSGLQEDDSPSVLMQSPFPNIDGESETDGKLSETRTRAELKRCEKPQLVTRKLTPASRLNSEKMCEEVKLGPVQRGRKKPTKTRKCRGVSLSSSDCTSNQEQSGPTSTRDDNAEKSSTFDSGEILSSESPPASSVHPNFSSVVSASESKQPAMEVEEEPTQAGSPENASTITTNKPGTLPPASEQPRQKKIYAHRQDATEAIKAMSQSLTSPPKASSTETECTAKVTPNKQNTVSSHTLIVMPQTNYINCQNSGLSDIEFSILSPTTPQDKPQPSSTLVSTSEKLLPPSGHQKTVIPTYATLQPVVSLLSSSTSKIQQPITYPNQQGKDLFQQKVLALASRQSQMNIKGRQQIIKLPVVISQPSKPTSMGSSVGASSDTPEKQQNLKKAASEIASPSSTCSESNVSTKLVPASISFVPPNVKENLSPVVRLPRLPVSVTSSKSVLVSRLCPIGSSQCTRMKQLISPVSGMPILPSNMSPTGSATTSTHGSVANLEQLKRIQDKASMSPESSLVFNETQPSTSSDVSVQALESKEDGNIVEEMTNMKEQQNNFCDVLQLFPVTPKESSHPHPHMTKSQFLAQLAVLPKTQVQEEAISSDVRKTRASSQMDSSKDENNLQKIHLLSQLHGHHKACLLDKKAETKLTASTTCQPSSIRSRKQRLSDIRNCEATTKDLTSVCPKKQVVLDDATNTILSPPSTLSHVNESRPSQEDVGPDIQPTLTSLVKPGSKSDDSKSDGGDIQEDPLGTPERTVSTERSPSILKPKRSSLLRYTPSADCMISENEKSSSRLKRSNPGQKGICSKECNSVSPSRSMSLGNGACTTESSTVSPKRSTSSGDGAHSQEASSESPSKSTSGGDKVHAKETSSSNTRKSTSAVDSACSDKSSSASLRGSNSDGDRLQSGESGSVSLRRSSSGKDDAHCKESRSVSPKMSNPGGDGVHCKESSSVRTRRSTLSGNGLLSKESSLRSLRRSTSGQASLSCKDSRSQSTRSISGKASARSEDSICVNTRSSTSGRTSVRSKESSSMSLRKSIPGRAVSSSSTSRADTRHSKKYSPVSLERSTSSSKTLSSKITETVGTPRRAKSILMRCKRLSEEATSSEKSLTACTCSKMSELSEKSSSLEMSCSCGSTSSKNCPEKDSSSLSLEMCSVNGANVPTEGPFGDIDSTSVLWSEIDTNGISSPKIAKAHTAKKPRIDRDNITPEKSTRAWILTSKNEAWTVAELQKWKNTKFEVCMLQNGAYSELKRWKTKGVWIPPKLPPGEVPHGDLEKMAKNDAKNASAKPKPVRPVGIVSPLQPLSVIGKFTLRNQCGQCGRTFTNNVALENHVSLHKKRRPFSCSLCGKSFPDSRALKRHDRVHRNGKIHICPECGKGFVYNFYLTKHLQMVHSTVRSVFCPICNKGFFTQREVDIHIRSHTGEKPFPCTLCDRKFSTRVKLNVHLRWHKGEKRHWCSFCTKGFLDYNNLKRHLLVHTGEKPYSCPLCSKCFSQSAHLKKHVTNVHRAK